MRTITFLFILALTSPALAQQRGEWFWDVDHGYGTGQPFTLPHNARADSASLSVPTTALDRGTHRLYIRTMDDTGRWSHTVSRAVEIVNEAPGRLRNAEYFWDIEPGFGAGHPLPLASVADTARLLQEVRNAQPLAPGLHRLYFRMQDDSGRWGHTVSRAVQRMEDTTARLTTLRYRIFPQPGVWKTVPISPPSITLRYLITDTLLVAGSYTIQAQVVDNQQDASCIVDTTFRVVANRGLLSKGIIVAPVPTHVELTVQAPSPQLPYQVIDLQGRCSSSGTLGYPIHTLNVAALPPGLYVLRMQTLEGPAAIRFEVE